MPTNEETGRACMLEDERAAAARSSAEEVGLEYVSDCRPGILRVREGDAFAYQREDGGPVTTAQLERIRTLAIPPAWTGVWICGDPDGHIQATGRDKRGRKQYRYHERWRAVRDSTKFDRMVAFAAALPAVRGRVDADLRARTLRREKLLALLVALLDTTLIRIGNPEYSRTNDSYGLTTLRDAHACVSGAQVRLRFRGKAGKERVESVTDRRLARAVQRSRDLPGQELFQYVDEDGAQRVVGSSDVNDYLRSISGEGITSKDFRTWGGTLVVASALSAEDVPRTRTSGEHAVLEAVREAADALGNTPAVCRKSYVHPGVVGLYLAGGLGTAWSSAEVEPRRWMREEEQRLLGVLRGLESRPQRWDGRVPAATSLPA